jgi:preprotein translocase subunit SecF
MIKRKSGTLAERAAGAMKTGLTMSLTGIFVMASLLVVSWYANITVLYQISLILFIGLIGDIIATWCTNAVIIMWYLERKKKRESKE